MILIEEVTQHGFINGFNTEGTMVARECTVCTDYLSTKFFSKNKNFKVGYNSVCKECDSKRNKEGYRKDPEKRKKQVRKYKSENYEKVLKSCKNSRTKNKEKYAVSSREWRLNNPAKAAFGPMKRRAQLGQANILKENKLAMKEMDIFYIHAKELTMYFGGVYEVDHIIPLQGDKVSGLHVPVNLQVLDRFSNRSKSDQFDGTYENESWRTDE